jgi:hypothetical protein
MSSGLQVFSGPASGVAGDRGGDLAGAKRSKRSAASAAPVRTPKRAPFTRSVKESRARDPRAREWAAVVLLCECRRSRPGRARARDGRPKDRDAQRLDAQAPQPGPAQPDAPRSSHRPTQCSSAAPRLHVRRHPSSVVMTAENANVWLAPKPPLADTCSRPQDRGRERRSPSPPSEPAVQFSRDGLSSQLFPHRDWRAD